MLNVFVTIGSWKFDNLIKHIDTLPSNQLNIVIQYGNGIYQPKNHTSFRLAPTIRNYILEADIVISHGGTGSILEILDLKKPLIAVPNIALKDNHQYEFVHFMQDQGLLLCIDNISDLTVDLIFNIATSKSSSTDLSMLFRDVIGSLDRFVSSGK